jgi:MFS family permease
VSRGRGPAALGALSGADFLVVFDGLVVSVALPSIQQELGFSDADLQWVVNAYLLTFGGLLLLGGRVADLVGRRLMLVTGLGIFGAGALAGGVAPSTGALVAARGAQGIGAALAVPAALALLAATFTEGRERTRALGVWSAIGSLAVPAGAVLGGVITASLGWRWVLLVSAPAAVVAAGAALASLAESRDENAPRRFDALGGLSATAGLTLLIFAIVQTERFPVLSAGVALPLTGAALLAVGFVRVERRASAPLVPPGAFDAPGLRQANLAAATLPVGLGALLFVGTLYLQRVVGLDAFETGLTYLGLSLPIVVGGPLGSRLVARLGLRATAVGGLLVQAAGVASLAAISPASGFAGVLPAFVVVGLAAPVAFVPVTTAAVERAGERTGLAAGLFNTSQQIGNALVLAVLATTAATYTATVLEQGLALDRALTDGYRVAFLVAAGVLVVGALFASRLPSPVDNLEHP